MELLHKIHQKKENTNICAQSYYVIIWNLHPAVSINYGWYRLVPHSSSNNLARCIPYHTDSEQMFINGHLWKLGNYFRKVLTALLQTDIAVDIPVVVLCKWLHAVVWAVLNWRRSYWTVFVFVSRGISHISWQRFASHILLTVIKIGLRSFRRNLVHWQMMTRQSSLQ